MYYPTLLVALAALSMTHSAHADSDSATNYYNIVDTGLGTYEVQCTNNTGTLTLYSAQPITVVEKGGPAVTVTQPESGTVTITCPRTNDEDQVEVVVDPEALLAAETSGNVPGKLFVNGERIRARDLVGGVYYLTQQSAPFLKVLTPAPGQVLQKGQIGEIRLLASEDMWGSTTFVYLQRAPSGLYQVTDAEGVALAPTVLAPTYTWDTMTRNVCHDWYLTFLVFTLDGQRRYQTAPFTILHDLSGICPSPLAY